MNSPVQVLLWTHVEPVPSFLLGKYLQVELLSQTTSNYPRKWLTHWTVSSRKPGQAWFPGWLQVPWLQVHRRLWPCVYWVTILRRKWQRHRLHELSAGTHSHLYTQVPVTSTHRLCTTQLLVSSEPAILFQLPISLQEGSKFFLEGFTWLGQAYPG